MPTSYNPCGDCNACCTRFVMPEVTWMTDGDKVGKPRNTTCDKWCDGGCTIYEDRPSACAEYQCLWLKINTSGGNLPIELRPDSTKVLVGAQYEAGIGRIFLEEMEKNAFDVMNPTPVQAQLLAEVLALMANQSMPTELFVRTYDWKTLRINVGLNKKNNNDDDLQQDQKRGV